MYKLLSLGLVVLAALPATTNFKLNSYGFGSGGTAKSSTSTYSIEGNTGTLSGAKSATANTGTKPGYIETQQANVPKLSVLDNGSNQYYNKLHFAIDTQGNPADAKYLLAISSSASGDACNATLCYVHPDGTISTTLATTDYQTYATWGGASGGLIIGLTPSTTYSVKLKATQGRFTESAYGPSTAQATAAPTLTFSLATSATSTPPFTVSVGTLTAGTVATSAQTINTSLTTNGASGGDIYIRSQNAGLLSGSTGFKIDTVSTDLSSTARGFGAQSGSVGQSSGGPFSVVSPYNGSANTIGLIDAALRSLYTSTAPVTNGNGVLSLKAKAASTDVAATDYQDVLTFVASANF